MSAKLVDPKTAHKTHWHILGRFLKNKKILIIPPVLVIGKLKSDFKKKAELNSINVPFFFEKHIRNKHLCRPDRSLYYFCKSKIPVINLVGGSGNRVVFSKYRVFHWF